MVAVSRPLVVFVRNERVWVGAGLILDVTLECFWASRELGV